jgi:large subunit ribosomal protein L14e
MLNDIGRICVKIAGRDANKTCVIVEVLDANYVMIDGETRRKKVNIRHLEPLDKTVELKKGASHADVKKAFSALGIELKEASKSKKSTTKPKKAKAKKTVVQDGKKK